jgi:DNA-binding transcriptional ArsR family regulator
MLKRPKAAGQSSADQAVWAALSDPTRRALLDRLANGPLSTTQLTAGAAMTRFGVAKHLKILEDCGLVVSRKHGRVRLHHVNAAPLVHLNKWLSPRAAAWANAAKKFSKSVEED